ncbi:MAG: class II glutamine amidotransferase [Deltaproteobacteria bacterium]|nr:class II glutamine amidotransferase [Deltaproteobacteria bacterium]
MAATTAVSPRALLHDAPRSLRALSREHPDGWGIASRGDDWLVERSTTCADLCARFGAVADRPATLVIAHIRKATVGPVALANTHPFVRGRYAFAHNGTLDTRPLAIAPAHAAAITGDTDSERLFAYLLSCLDAGSLDRGAASLAGLGSASFLLSDGNRLYAHRLGRALFTLHRPGSALVASEPLTDEPWHELSEGALVEVTPAAAALAA